MNALQNLVILATGIPSVLGGICILIIMVKAFQRKGPLALLLLPFALHCLLWTSWSQLRNQWFFSDHSWIIEHQVWVGIYQWGQIAFYWLCLLPAFIPALLKDKIPNAKP